MSELQIIEIRGQRVLTTKQIAEAYKADVKTIHYNFRYNKDRYKEGKHYIEIVGEELRRLKTRNEFQSSFKYAKSLYLWTEKGALLHAKSLNTDEAWEVYDYLVDFYFHAKKETTLPARVKKETVANPNTMTVVDVPENPEILNGIQKIRNDLTAMNVLLENCIRYSSEEVYNRKREVASDVVSIITHDWNRLFEMKPKMVQKIY